MRLNDPRFLCTHSAGARVLGASMAPRITWACFHSSGKPPHQGCNQHALDCASSPTSRWSTSRPLGHPPPPTCIIANWQPIHSNGANADFALQRTPLETRSCVHNAAMVITYAAIQCRAIHTCARGPYTPGKTYVFHSCWLCYMGPPCI